MEADIDLCRFAYFPDRTLGQLQYLDYRWWTIENPWLDNTPYISCIPEDNYAMARFDSNKHGANRWQIMAVPNRTLILLHVANTAANVLGCLGLGKGLYGDLAGVARSRIAVGEFYEATEGKTNLRIDIRSGCTKEFATV